MAAKIKRIIEDDGTIRYYLGDFTITQRDPLSLLMKVNIMSIGSKV